MFICVLVNVSVECYFTVFLYIFTFFTHSFAFFTFIFFYMYTCIFPYLYIFIFSYFHTFSFFYFGAFFILIFVLFVLAVIMYCNTFDWMSLCDCMLMYVWYVSVLVYCPTYCGECLMRGRRCLLNGQHLIPWARVYTVEVLSNIVYFHQFFNK